jgi:hypothetical protein
MSKLLQGIFDLPDDGQLNRRSSSLLGILVFLVALSLLYTLYLPLVKLIGTQLAYFAWPSLALPAGIIAAIVIVALATIPGAIVSHLARKLVNNLPRSTQLHLYRYMLITLVIAGALLFVWSLIPLIVKN